MKKVLLVCFWLMCSNMLLLAQNKTVSGTVTEEDGTPLAGVTVTLDGGTKTSVTTNKDGKFSIQVPATGEQKLVLTHAGFVPKTINAGESPIAVALQKELQSLDDVVVIGYQTVKRRDLVNSVSSISAKDIKDIPINSTAEALTGRLAGVQITMSEGSPDAEATIRVRGGGSITQDNSPLYIVDGIQVENALNVLAPQDIQNIDVLKDASATAIYGARGANGVVIITTKAGRNMKPVVTYNALAGTRRLANKLDVMKPYDFVMYQYERTRSSQADRDGFLNTYGTYDDIELYKDAPFVDWQALNLGRNAMMQTHNVSLTGGSATTKYNASLTSNKEDGVMRNSDFDRKLVSLKLDQTINDKAKAGVAVRYNYTNVRGAGTSNAGSSSLNQLRQSIKNRPILMNDANVLDYDPDYADATNANSLSLVNPLLLNDATYRRRLNTTLNLSGYVSYDFNKYVSFKTTLGVDLYNTRQESFDDTLTSNARSNFEMPVAGIKTAGTTSINNSNVLTFTMNKSGTNFSKRNDLDVILGHELYQTTIRANETVVKYFPVGVTAKQALSNMGMAQTPVGGLQPLPTSNELQAKLVSFFGRINYTFDKKYMFMLTVRSDGSSKFAEQNRWGYFPSGSFAWRLSEEDFIKNLSPAISDLKFRVSYGQAGNNRIDDFLYLTQYVSNPSLSAINAFYSLNNGIIPPFYSPELANENLKWETTISQNIGFDISLWRNRFSLSADYYHNKTRDLLVDVTVPSSSGYTTQVQNVGSTYNRGFEFQLSGAPISKKDFSWNSSLNISFNKNKITSLGAYQNSFLFSSGWGGGNQPSDFLVRVGQPVGVIWGLVTDGYYKVEDFDYNGGVYTLKSGVPSNQGITSVAPRPGSLKFKDISGRGPDGKPDGKPDGVVDDLDRTIIGNTQPKFFGGWNHQLTYKNFDLSVFLNFQFGNDVYNANKLEFTSGYTPNSNLLAMMNDRWRNVDAQGQVVTDPTQLAAMNANAKLWSPLTTASSFYVHSWAVEDGSFLRVNNVTLGYTLPRNWLNRVKVKSLRVYGTVNNLAILTNYTGYDPEVNTRRGTPLTPGVDYSAYPRSRAFIVGANLSF